MPASLQDMYVQVLLDLVLDENYPNPDHLDRIEASVGNPAPLSEYVEVLFSRPEATRHPSIDLAQPDRTAGCGRADGIAGCGRADGTAGCGRADGTAEGGGARVSRSGLTE